LSRYLMNGDSAKPNQRGTKMKTLSNKTQSGTHSTQHLSRSCNRSGTRRALSLAATLLCGLGVVGFSGSAAAQQKTLSEAIAEHPGWAQLPGELIRPDCVHEIPKGARVEIAKDGSLTGDVTMNGELIAHYDACPEEAVATRGAAQTQSMAEAKEELTGNGWVEDDQWNAPLSSSDNIDYLGANWVVPAYPSEASSQLIYFFDGIEPASHKWALEAALQYGYNGVWGGNYYSVTTFLTSASAVYYSSPDYVNPGDSLSGIVQMTGISGSTTYWDVLIVDNYTGAGSEGSYWVSGQHWTWAYRGAVAAYNLYACAEFPTSGREVFTDAVVAHGFPYLYEMSPNWVGAIPGYGGPTCHFAVVAASGTLDF
jgi:hypothetical protein